MPDYLKLHRERQLDALMRAQAPAMRKEFWDRKAAQATEERRQPGRPWALAPQPFMP